MCAQFVHLCMRKRKRSETQVLDALPPSIERRTSDVARQLDISRSTAYNYLDDLHEQGVVEKTKISETDCVWRLNPGERSE